jgi:serine protease AprX
MATRILKTFDAAPEALAAIPGVRTLQAYPAFTVIEAEDDAAAAAAGRTGLTEDITANYVLQSGEKPIDTGIPRMTADGASQQHPAYADQNPLPGGPHHFIVQFVGPIRDEWLSGLVLTGAEVVAPYQHYAVIVRATARQAGAISQLKYVRWAGHLPYAARLSPTAASDPTEPSENAPRTRLLPGAFNVEFFKNEQASAARAAVAKLGFEIIEDLSASGILVVRSTPDSSDDALQGRLQALSMVHGVRQIGRKAISRISNDRAAVVMGAATALGTPGLGLSGAGQIIGICDTGLDTGVPATIHPDFTGRIAAIRSYPISPAFSAYVTNPGADDGPSDVDSGHGTHTSGSILGSGVSSTNLPGLAGPVRGLAYGASLVMQAVEQRVRWKPGQAPPDGSRYALAGLPSDLTDLFTWSYGQGARIHSNSWGGGDAQDYDANCGQIDAFVWSNPDFCILFAAGNDGKDSDGDGQIDSGSVTPPGTAKNCITVGASDNNRPEINQTNGDLWGPTAAPTAALAAGDPANMAPFSSRGPTRDGRIKPEIVAPGTYVLSTRSRLLSEKTWGYGRYGTSSLYMFDCGTSMATPLTAGAVAVIRQYLRIEMAIPAPSAALLKASIVVGAVAINGRGGPPDMDQGFGRIDVDAVVAPAAPLKATFIEGPKLATGDLNEHVVQVVAPGCPIKVSMAYSDYPGPNLVNNLNLIVRGPDGTVLTGNAAGGSTTLDKINNVETVLMPNAAHGAWRVQVVASNVANGPQSFALAILAAS